MIGMSHKVFMPNEVCTGCGAVFPQMDGPTHPYMMSSPRCWAYYGEVLAREYSNLAYYAVHRLTVDAYALQHPGTPSPQALRSVALHGITLCAIFEHNVPLSDAGRVIQGAARDKSVYRWLPPPTSMGALTIADVWTARDAQEHGHLVWAWAKSAWHAWADHHPTFQRWLAACWPP